MARKRATRRDRRPAGADSAADEPSAARTDDQRFQGNRGRLLAATAMALPLVAVALIELALRTAGVAAPEPLFVAAAQDGYLQPNDQVARRYFPGLEGAPPTSIDTTYFRAEKGPEAFRVVVQGGSSAAGFPYGKWASLAGLLQQRLSRTLPHREVEVISTAMSAVNSFTLLDLADEIIAIQPDAIVIYAGHNEYLGAMGVASAQAASSWPALTRVLLGLKDVRLLQLAIGLGGAVSGQPEDRTGTLMARIAGDRPIPLDSTLFFAGKRQFEENLDRLLGRYRDAGIPVFIGTLASNDRDQFPFQPAPCPDAAGVDLATDLDTQAGDRDRLTELAGRCPGAAAVHYRLAQALLANGEAEAAGRAFERARDLDQLRFRAPEAFNAIIREQAEVHGARLVESRAALAAHAPDGIIGNDQMLEHLHPNREGYFNLADAYYEAMLEAGAAGDDVRPVPRNVALDELPLTDVDRLAGEYRVARLLNDWPFQVPPIPLELPEPDNEIERIAQDWFFKRIEWADAMQRALAFYQETGNLREAARVAVNLAGAYPFAPDPHYVAGQLLVDSGQRARALPFLHRAASLAPRRPDYLLGLARGYFVNDQLPESRRVLETLVRLYPDHPTAGRFLRRIKERQGEG